MKFLSTIWIVFFLFSANAQSDSLKHSWVEKASYDIGANEVWSVDVLENVYVSRNGSIEKFDSAGVMKFTQSIKSLGRMTQMLPVNTMKLVHFSEEQQTICYLDNTLSPLDDCIDLAEEGIINGAMVAASNQPNKLWVVDDLNSRLLLLPLNNSGQAQELTNVAGILDLGRIHQILERNNQLLLLDREKGVYMFDLYGSLIEFIAMKSIQQLDANQQMLFTLKENELSIRAFKTGDVFAVKLPIGGVYEMAYRNKNFYFRTATHVHKFALQFSK